MHWAAAALLEAKMEMEVKTRSSTIEALEQHRYTW
jgi:hypothetical protein